MFEMTVNKLSSYAAPLHLSATLIIEDDSFKKINHYKIALFLVRLKLL